MVNPDNYPNIGGGELVVDVEVPSSCINLISQLIANCFSAIRPRYTSFSNEETHSHYLDYLKEQSNDIINFAKNSPLLEMYCDLTDNFEISKLRNKLFEKAKEIDNLIILNTPIWKN